MFLYVCGYIFYFVFFNVILIDFINLLFFIDIWYEI